MKSNKRKPISFTSKKDFNKENIVNYREYVIIFDYNKMKKQFKFIKTRGDYK